MSELDETLLDAINRLGPSAWSGTTYRWTTARRDPLSGEGARRFGGRWNPQALFPTVYLAQPVRTCLLELDKAARDDHLTVAEKLQVPIKLHTIEITDVPVLDLRTETARERLGLEPEDLSDDWATCQPIGHAAWFLEYAGVLVPSAMHEGLTLALFEHRVAPEHVTVSDSSLLDFKTYERLVAGD